MQAYQSLDQMETIMNQERKFARPLSLPAVPFKQDQLPRFFQEVPLAMNSPLNAEQFAVWPPTPRNPRGQAAIEAPYPFSMPEATSGVCTTTSWDTPEQSTVTSGMEQLSQYNSPVESKVTLAEPFTYQPTYSHPSWPSSRPTSGDYTSLLTDDAFSTGYHSPAESTLLGPSAYITRSPAQSEILTLDTNIPRRPSYTETVASSTPSVYDIPTPNTSSYDGSYLDTYHPTPAITPISPVIRSASRSPARRFEPYDKSKRWSTGNYSNSPLDLSPFPHSSPITAPTYNHPPPTYPFFPPALESQLHHPYPCLPSHPHDHPHPTHSAPPDLYAHIYEAQSPPPPEDMNPSDPSMKPHEQDLRFDGDLYTPRWVRGHGNKREGWCGLCKPGRWLVLKNSAFWYDKSFTHGIAASTGDRFEEPVEVRRVEGGEGWEGRCGGCEEWVAIGAGGNGGRKRGTTWFRHKYKCGNHSKGKEGGRRRGESHSKGMKNEF